MHISLWGMMSTSCDVVAIFSRIMCPFLMASCVKCLRMWMCLALSWPPLMLFYHSMQSVLCLGDLTTVYTPELELSLIS